ncbi:hypothetical protein K9O30_06195 [Clostridium bowmanii]|uniref:hypothetical protein n=1 Tax=Clostridium bowmanii TaxID=132925 RepID=UPI001C0CE73F|nr:hypothetical protein [Clostridium bowmanii]MBU3188750.1 hypothetical protein [Clostridium bowmanii]MCA1073335.1 hypothetical protein [Clostridium bowmanii]
MKSKKIIIISIGFITSILIVLVFLLNYNKNKLIEDKIYTILKITNVGTTPSVVVECRNDHTVRCFKLKNNYSYNVKLPQESLIREDENVYYKKYGNFVFHKEELEIKDDTEDTGKASLKLNFDNLSEQLEDIKSQMNGSDEQLLDIQGKISDIMIEMGL